MYPIWAMRHASDCASSLQLRGSAVDEISGVRAFRFEGEQSNRCKNGITRRALLQAAPSASILLGAPAFADEPITLRARRFGIEVLRGGHVIHQLLHRSLGQNGILKLERDGSGWIVTASSIRL